MHFLAVLSMKNRALIALITIVAAIFGSLALTSLKQELIPSLQLPQLLVSTSYPGASPEVVNDDVSTPIETAIQGIAGLESTSTTSSTNSSLVSARLPKMAATTVISAISARFFMLSTARKCMAQYRIDL